MKIIYRQTSKQKKTWGERWFILTFILLASCTPITSPYSSRTDIQPISPIVTTSNLLLKENRWRLVDITVQGQPVEVDTLGTIYFSFGSFQEVNSLSVTIINCVGFASTIVFEPANHFRLSRAIGPAASCGEIKDLQKGHLAAAIGATTIYQIQGNQLILSGEQARIVLEADNF